MDTSETTLELALSRARALGLEATETEFRFVAHGIGPFPDLAIGPTFRSLNVSYPGPDELAFDPDYVGGSAWQPADPAVREVCAVLLAACRNEGVCLWFGGSTAETGCKVRYAPPAATKVQMLCEDIHSTRKAALQWPGQGHEGRLAGLMQDLEAAS
jgi:hypothetical protein